VSNSGDTKTFWGHGRYKLGKADIAPAAYRDSAGRTINKISRRREEVCSVCGRKGSDLKGGEEAVGGR
jgi:hypothetical protein